MDFALDSSGGPPGPLAGRSVWTARELPAREEWNHRLDDVERDELRAVAARADGAGAETTVDGRPIEETGASDLPLPRLARRLATIRGQLETGAGVVRMHGFPLAGLTPGQARAAYWSMAVHLGTPVSQSARGERIYSVLDAGFSDDDPRSRGPNTSKRLSFHTDRADVVGFLCLSGAREGGENEIASSTAVYNAILRRRPDLLHELMQPFYYLRHTIDTANERPWCRLPVFSFRDGFFACCLLRVLIERAHRHPDLPDLTARQIEALDLVEETAGSDPFRVAFRQEPGDLVWINNWTVLHKRRAFVDHDDPARRRHILRVWLSMPDSRPLDPRFADHFGAVEAGALRGGIRG
jgi:hypothetical protein